MVYPCQHALLRSVSVSFLLICPFQACEKQVCSYCSCEAHSSFLTDPLVSLYAALLDQRSIKHATQLRIQHALHSACTLLQSTKNYAYSPSKSKSAPSLVFNLCHALKQPAQKGQAACFSIDPSLSAVLASSVLSTQNTQLAQSTAELLIQLSATPPPSQHEAEADASEALTEVAAAAKAAAKRLLDRWTADGLPVSNEGLLLLLPALSSAAGAPLMHPLLQEMMESALYSKTNPGCVREPLGVFEKVGLRLRLPGLWLLPTLLKKESGVYVVSMLCLICLK